MGRLALLCTKGVCAARGVEERLEEIMESIAIGQDWEDDVRVVLFVVMRAGEALELVPSDR